MNPPERSAFLWRLVCSCGYASAPRPFEEVARAAETHDRDMPHAHVRVTLVKTGGSRMPGSVLDAREWAGKVARLSVRLVEEAATDPLARRHYEAASIALDKAARHLLAAVGEEGFP